MTYVVCALFVANGRAITPLSCHCVVMILSARRPPIQTFPHCTKCNQATIEVRLVHQPSYRFATVNSIGLHYKELWCRVVVMTLARMSQSCTKCTTKGQCTNYIVSKLSYHVHALHAESCRIKVMSFLWLLTAVPNVAIFL